MPRTMNASNATPARHLTETQGVAKKKKQLDKLEVNLEFHKKIQADVSVPEFPKAKKQATKTNEVGTYNLRSRQVPHLDLKAKKTVTLRAKPKADLFLPRPKKVNKKATEIDTNTLYDLKSVHVATVVPHKKIVIFSPKLENVQLIPFKKPSDQERIDPNFTHVIQNGHFIKKFNEVNGIKNGPAVLQNWVFEHQYTYKNNTRCGAFTHTDKEEEYTRIGYYDENGFACIKAPDGDRSLVIFEKGMSIQRQQSKGLLTKSFTHVNGQFTNR